VIEVTRRARWTLYIVECADGSLYTGITTDLLLRVEAHSEGLGAKYTRGRGPVHLRYQRRGLTRSQALREERRVKRLSREQKLALCRARVECAHGQALSPLFRLSGGVKPPGMTSTNNCWCCGVWLGPEDYDGTCPCCDATTDEEM
jgi:putative endonuclease